VAFGDKKRLCLAACWDCIIGLAEDYATLTRQTATRPDHAYPAISSSRIAHHKGHKGFQ